MFSGLKWMIVGKVLGREGDYFYFPLAGVFSFCGDGWIPGLTVVEFLLAVVDGIVWSLLTSIPLNVIAVTKPLVVVKYDTGRIPTVIHQSLLLLLLSLSNIIDAKILACHSILRVTNLSRPPYQDTNQPTHKQETSITTSQKWPPSHPSNSNQHQQNSCITNTTNIPQEKQDTIQVKEKTTGDDDRP